MATEYVPDHDGRGLRICLVAARFNYEHVRRLVDAGLEVLKGRGVSDEDLTVAWVPGSFELPLAARWAADSGRFDAVLAFGVVIRGDTDHFRLVADASSQGLLRVSLDTGIPVLNGVLAVESAAQALERSGGTIGNRGADVALAAIQMATLRRTMEKA